MSEVKTYAVNCNDAWLNTDGDDVSGSYVKYADYKALAIRLDIAEHAWAALAAENAALKKFCKDAAFDADYEAELGMERGGFSDALNEIKTPATDALLAEIERKAIRKFINSIEHIMRDKLSPYDTEEMLEAMRIFLEEQGAKR